MQDGLLYNKKESILAQNKKYYDAWRYWMIRSSLLAVSALIPASVDYEGSYSNIRYFDTCYREHYHSEFWLFLSGLLSLLAIVLMVPYRYFFLKWTKHLSETYKELPPLRSRNILEIRKGRSKIKLRNVFDAKTGGIIVLYLIFPIPFMKVDVYIPQVIDYNTEICYNLNEIFYTIMFARVLILVVYSFSFTKYQNQIALQHCEKYGVEAVPMFSIKCILNERPMFVLVFIVLIPSIIMLALVLRVYERPAQIGGSEEYVENLQNGIWFVFISMTTVGYGAIYPVTLPGRVVSCLAIIIGGIIISESFAAMAQYLYLASNQRKAYGSILMSKAAAQVILTLFKYNLLKPPLSNATKIAYWNNVVKAIRKFKVVKHENAIVFDDYIPEFKRLKAKIEKLESEVQFMKNDLYEFLDNGSDPLTIN